MAHSAAREEPEFLRLSSLLQGPADMMIWDCWWARLKNYWTLGLPQSSDLTQYVWQKKRGLKGKVGLGLFVSTNVTSDDLTDAIVPGFEGRRLRFELPTNSDYDLTETS